jgi:hypothetical protein
VIERVVISLAWTPPPKLSPNAGAHWATKNKLRKEGRDAAINAARQWRNDRGLFGTDPVVTAKARIFVTIRWGKGRRFMDADNAVACLKGPVDGLTQAGIIPDDSPAYLVWEPVEQKRDPTGRGETVIVIEEMP